MKVLNTFFICKLKHNRSPSTQDAHDKIQCNFLPEEMSDANSADEFKGRLHKHTREKEIESSADRFR